MKTNKFLNTLVVLALLMTAVPVISAGASGTTVVQPSSLNGWGFLLETGASGAGNFVNGPNTAPLGNGSVHFTTGDASDGILIGLGGYANIKLSDITSLRYSTYQSLASTSTVQVASLQFNIDNDLTDADTSWKGRLVFEPYYSETIVNGTWQTWDTRAQGKWWATGSPMNSVCSIASACSWADVLTNFPNAGINSIFGGVLFKVGSGWPAGFDGNVDALTIGISGDDTTFDFEPETPCTTICYADVVNGNDAFGGDTPASAKKTIQAAINQVSVGGTVIVAAGTYNENLDIAKPLSMQGTGNGTNPLEDTIIDPSGGLYGIFMHQPVNLMDLRITDAPSHGIRVQSLSGRLNFSNVTWQNIASSANGDRGIELHNGTDVSNMAIINSEFVGNTGIGIRSASDVTIDGLTITDSLFNQNSYGIYLQGTINNLTMAGSIFNDNVAWGTYMTETGPLTNVVIEDSKFTDNQAGMTIWNTKDNSDIAITRTVFEGNDAWGVFIGGNSLTNVSIQDSQFLNNDALNLGYYAIWFDSDLDSLSNVTVNANNITGQGEGLYNADLAQIDGTCNWWGAADGPSGLGSGSGDAVTDYVTFTPWLISAAPGGQCSGMPDTEGPVISNVLASPNPVAINGSVNLTALVDDTTTGGSNIESAEYSLDGGAWALMSASDSAFDEISENVSVNFTASSTPGIYDLCVRGTDERGNVGDSECTIFVVYDPSGGFVTGGGWIDSPVGAVAPVPSLVWNQGFEGNSDGWSDINSDWHGLVTRSPSGSNGILSSKGSYHAIFEGDTESGPFTRFDGYRAVWPGTWTAEIDIYLDPVWGSGQGFDYSVAANGSDGAHQRDYIFHVTKDTSTGKLFVAGSNNTNFAPREDLESINHYEINTAGWYTFQHVFRDQDGALAVDLNLLDLNGNLLFTETRYNAADLIPQEVGGNRYGWFTFINVAGGIAGDEHQLFIPSSPTGKATFGFVSKYKKGASTPDGNTEFKFMAGNLNFSSTSYEWLVVNQAGANAQFKGFGTINGTGNYGFMLWATDGSPDKFRIKIWDAATEAVVYDNGMDQPIGGGSIVVHKK